jgi:GTP-binding protein LepA
LKCCLLQVVLVTPERYYGAMVDLIKERRGSSLDVQYLDDGSVKLTALVPWQEVVCDMNDQVKHGSAGYASFNYEEAEYAAADLVKVEIAVNGEPCDPLSFVCHRDKAEASGRRLALKLKDVVARQQFEIILQARIGAKVSPFNVMGGYFFTLVFLISSQIVAKERIAPYRKDVLIRSGKVSTH